MKKLALSFAFVVFFVGFTARVISAQNQRYETPALYIWDAYERFLGRYGSIEAGSTYWMGQYSNLLNNCNPQDIICQDNARANIAQAFIESLEFANRSGLNVWNNAELLLVCYRYLFGREPDPDGYAFWLSALNSTNDRAGLIRVFVQDPEFKQLWQSSATTPPLRVYFTISGVPVVDVTIPYDPIQHRYIRNRFFTPARQLLIESSPDVTFNNPTLIATVDFGLRETRPIQTELAIGRNGQTQAGGWINIYPFSPTLQNNTAWDFGWRAYGWQPGTPSINLGMCTTTRDTLSGEWLFISPRAPCW